jgi:cytidyltransferase-like protein
MTRVYADMVADLFHYGHVEFLRKARELGTYLIAGIVADDVAELSKKKPILTMGERVASVAGCKYVDQVLPNAPWRIDRAWILLHHIQLVVHGDDYSQEQLDDIYKVPMEMGILRTVPYTSSISTTEIVRRILERNL